MPTTNPPTTPPPVATASPATTPTPMTKEQRATFEWLTNQGHMLSLMVVSTLPALKNLGIAMTGRLLDEYRTVFMDDIVKASAQRTEQGVAAQVKGDLDMTVAGPKLWAALHKRAVAYLPTSAAIAAAEAAWLEVVFPGMIPCPVCRLDFVQRREKNPPPLTSAQPLAYFYWTVDVHNEVNTKLGKATKTYSQAEVEWTAK